MLCCFSRQSFCCMVLASILFFLPSTSDAATPGSRGVITYSGVTGLFLNPSSGTPAKGAITTQACIGDYSWGDERLTWTGGIVTYGVSDRLEIGWSHAHDKHPQMDQSHTVTGPHFRLRLLEEKRGRPEVSIGGVSYRGHALHQRDEWFLATSKALSPASAKHGFRLHLGVRGQTQNGGMMRRHFMALKKPWYKPMAENQATVIYTGLEYGLSRAVSLIGEVSTRGGDVYEKTPWAAGFQYKEPGQNFGCTLALAQTGYLNNPGVYFGIGINF